MSTGLGASAWIIDLVLGVRVAVAANLLHVLSGIDPGVAFAMGDQAMGGAAKAFRTADFPMAREPVSAQSRNPGMDVVGGAIFAVATKA